MSRRLLRDYFDAIKNAERPEELEQQMQKFSQELGFERFVYAHIVNFPSLKPQQYVISGYPKEWGNLYLTRDYFRIDPLVRLARSSSLPIVWDEHQMEGGKDLEFWEEARAHGLCSGLTLAVRERPGITGMFSLARDRGMDVDGKDLAAVIGQAHMFTTLLHHAVSSIELPRLLPEHGVSLTARERECLLWSAEGKTAWELGQILGITERTAVFHTNNAIQKLGASNKTQAIVRAVALRLI